MSGVQVLHGAFDVPTCCFVVPNMELDLQPGDVVTTGTWTDAFAIASGEHWQAQFSAPLPSLSVTMK